MKTAVVDYFLLYKDKDVITGKNVCKKSSATSEMNFVLVEPSESRSTYLEQLEHDSESVKKILSHKGRKTEGNVTVVRRLSKIIILLKDT